MDVTGLAPPRPAATARARFLIIDGVAKALESGGVPGSCGPVSSRFSRDGEVRVERLRAIRRDPAFLDEHGLAAALSRNGARRSSRTRRLTRWGRLLSGRHRSGGVTDSPLGLPGLGRGAGADQLFPHGLTVCCVRRSAAATAFASTGDLRRELGQFIVASGHLPSSFHFSRFLRDLELPREPAAGAHRAGPQRATAQDAPWCRCSKNRRSSRFSRGSGARSKNRYARLLVSCAKAPSSRAASLDRAASRSGRLDRLGAPDRVR